MRELTFDEVSEISGAKFKFKLKVNLGSLLAGVCLGWITAGPVGVGYALCTAVAAQGFEELKDLAMGNDE